MPLRILLTGAAGFIGSHLSERLLASGHTVIGVDNLDPFYPARTKRRNLAAAQSAKRFTFIEGDITDPESLEARIRAHWFDSVDVIVHLAARAGVRPSLEHPGLYVHTNVDGTLATLELARRLNATRFVFGSSSSVYGSNAKTPFAEDDPVDHPISPYAATKRAGELLCHTYHHLYGLSVVCLRLFTVYGPRQRPDLAIHKFTKLISQGAAIPMFGDGSTRRDYTYVDDVVRGIESAVAFTGGRKPAYEIVNLGGSDTTSLSRLVDLISTALGIEARIEHLPAQPGDLDVTFADVAKAKRLLGYRPATKVEQGIPRFVEWYMQNP